MQGYRCLEFEIDGNNVKVYSSLNSKKNKNAIRDIVAILYVSLIELDKKGIVAAPFDRISILLNDKNLKRTSRIGGWFDVYFSFKQGDLTEDDFFACLSVRAYPNALNRLLYIPVGYQGMEKHYRFLVRPYWFQNTLKNIFEGLWCHESELEFAIRDMVTQAEIKSNFLDFYDFDILEKFESGNSLEILTFSGKNRKDILIQILLKFKSFGKE